MQKEAIIVALRANVPIVLKGDPGIGKTSFFQQTAEAEEAHLIELIASIHDPTDFGGLPVKHDDRVHKAPMAWAIEAQEMALAGKQVWVFFDEISTAAPATQAALMRVTHERKVGDLVLPKTVRMLAAMNPPETAAGGWDLAPPLANRFWHFDWFVKPAEWVDGIIEGFPHIVLPPLDREWETNTLPSQMALVASFIKAKGQLLLAVPTDESKAGGAWPSPRSWAMAGKLMAVATASSVNDDVKMTLVTGAVGEGAATEFYGWLKAQDLPDPEDLLKNPTSFTLPDRSDKTFTVLSSVVAAVKQDMTPDRYVAAWEILSRAGEQGAVDVAAPSVKSLAKAAKGQVMPNIGSYVKKFIPILKEAGLLTDE